MSALQNINRDITDHAEMNQLGMDIDREHWLKLRAAIQHEIAFRKNDAN
jgi:L-asparaginase/Glu-tRNA(Gln) amidotransferase subunit D